MQLKLFHSNGVALYILRIMNEIKKLLIKRKFKTKLFWRKDRKEFLELIDFFIFQKIFSLLSKSNNTILEIGSYDGYSFE